MTIENIIPLVMEDEGSSINSYQHGLKRDNKMTLPERGDNMKTFTTQGLFRRCISPDENINRIVLL